MTAAAHRVLERKLKDAFDLIAMIDVGVVCGVTAVQAALLAEIHSTCEFADAEEVRAVHEFLLQGALVDQRGESLDGAKIGV